MPTSNQDGGVRSRSRVARRVVVDRPFCQFRRSQLLVQQRAEPIELPQVQRSKVEEEVPVNECIIDGKPVTPFARRGLVVSYATVVEAAFYYSSGGRRRHARAGSSRVRESGAVTVNWRACGSSPGASGAVTVSLSCSRGAGSRSPGLAGLLSHRTPIAAAPARAHRRRDRAGSAGWSRECLRSTLGQPPATSWLRSPMAHALPQWELCEMALGGSCEAHAEGPHGSRGAERGLAVAARRRRAAVSRRAADTRRGSAPMNHNSVVDGPGPRDGGQAPLLKPRRGAEDTTKDA